MHPNSILIFQRYAIDRFKDGDKVLEIGPDGFPSTYQKITEQTKTAISWKTLDIINESKLDYVAESEYVFPVPDETFDIIISGQVIEHVKMPWKWIAELARVVKKGGLVITICPVSWPYHEAPVDCWRIYPEGMIALYQQAGLKVEVAEWGSWETPEFRRHTPGKSLIYTGKLRFLYSLLGRFGFPVERSYDCIAIGQK